MPEPTERPHPSVLGAAAVAHGKGTCQACGGEFTTRLDGMFKRAHNVTVVHNPSAHKDNHVTTTHECHGSRLPPAEYAEVFDRERLRR